MRLTNTQRRLIEGFAQRSGSRAEIEHVATRPWASATFVGTRHRLRLQYSNPDAREAVDRLGDGLESAEFDLRGDLLVDIAMVDACPQTDGVLVTIEALTIEAD